jgi:KaiC/GvpD/RAD55 family RecA-like ATPase
VGGRPLRASDGNLLGSMILILTLASLIALMATPSAAASSAVARRNIRASVLKRGVTLDGQVTQTDEWSDAEENHLSIECSGPCILDAPSSVEVSIQAKHDDLWMYFLYKVDWPHPYSSTNQVGLMYYWSQTGYPKWDGGDDVEDSLEYGVMDYYWDPTVTGPGWKFKADTKGGGRIDATGSASYDGKTYFFEFRKLLSSGDGLDPFYSAGKTYGMPGSDGEMQTYFESRVGNTLQGGYWAYISLSLCPCAPVVSASSTTETIGTSRSVTEVAAASSTAIPKSITITPAQTPTTTQAAVSQPLVVQMPFGMVGVGGVLTIVAIVSAIAVFVLRRKGASAVAASEAPGVVQPPLSGISTGYPDLDRLLAGGLPEGYAILILSASWDERNLLLRRIIGSSIRSGRPTFFVSNDVNTTQELAGMYANSFYAYSGLADKMTSPHRNLNRIPGVGNLSEFTISLSEAIKGSGVSADRHKLLVVDVLSELVLRHKALNTVRWLSDFLAKRKVEQFTIIATLNPSIASNQEIQPIFDLFDGLIEIYEKALGERTRRFLVIKKLHGRKYDDADLMLDREKLF